MPSQSFLITLHPPNTWRQRYSARPICTAKVGSQGLYRLSDTGLKAGPWAPPQPSVTPWDCGCQHQPLCLAQGEHAEGILGGVKGVSKYGTSESSFWGHHWPPHLGAWREPNSEEQWVREGDGAHQSDKLEHPKPPAASPRGGCSHPSAVGSKAHRFISRSPVYMRVGCLLHMTNTSYKCARD